MGDSNSASLMCACLWLNGTSVAFVEEEIWVIAACGGCFSSSVDQWMAGNETHFQFPNMIDGGLFKQRAPLTNIDCSVVLPHHMLQRLGSHDLRLNNRLHNWWVVSLVQFDSLAFSAYVSFPGFSCWGKWSCNVLTQALLRTSAGRGLRSPHPPFANQLQCKWNKHFSNSLLE